MLCKLDVAAVKITALKAMVMMDTMVQGVDNEGVCTSGLSCVQLYVAIDRYHDDRNSAYENANSTKLQPDIAIATMA